MVLQKRTNLTVQLGYVRIGLIIELVVQENVRIKLSGR